MEMATMMADIPPPPSAEMIPLSSQVLTTEHVKQFMEILKSLTAKQGPPPPVKSSDAAKEGLRARASRLEFKAVNEVYVFIEHKSNLARANTMQLG
jgi:hypothetical protein